MATSSEDSEFDCASAQVALLSERMARKLQMYVRRNVHAASQEIWASTMASLQESERRLRLRIHATTIHNSNQVEQLKDHLHDVREEIWQLIEKQETKQEFHLTQILEDIRELSNCLHQALTRGIFVMRSSQSNFVEGASEPEIKEQNVGKVLKPAVEQSEAAALRNKLVDMQKVDHEAALHVKSSSLCIQPQSLSAYSSFDSATKALQNIGLIDQAAAAPAVSSCNIVLEQLTDDKNSKGSADYQEKAFRLSCKTAQEEKLSPLESFGEKLEEKKLSAVCDTTILRTQEIKACKTGQQGQTDSKERRMRAFSFHFADSKEIMLEASDGIKEIEDAGFVILKERNACNLTMPSNSRHFLKKNSAIQLKQQRSRVIKLQRGYKGPCCQFTNLDIERLVMAVEKLGIGRWRDIKETYFSVDMLLSAAKLKDKWRSLVYSAKLHAAKQRSLKMSSALVKRVLKLDKRDKLPRARR
ncbi:hypothetical protein L7F22_000169 [Adiantum nelumboides]|nr:hypothetical protein [Adiantum nelumboides]